MSDIRDTLMPWFCYRPAEDEVANGLTASACFAEPSDQESDGYGMLRIMYGQRSTLSTGGDGSTLTHARKLGIIRVCTVMVHDPPLSLIYAYNNDDVAGWGKKLSYCIAFSADGAMDVTRRYVRNPWEYGLERNRGSEAVLLYIMNEIRSMRRSNMSKQDVLHLEEEDMRENRELRNYVIAQIVCEVCKIRAEDILNGRVTSRADLDAQKESKGRASGNAQWIRARGEGGQGTPNEQDPRNQNT